MPTGILLIEEEAGRTAAHDAANDDRAFKG
jgi:hypothetical protein